MNDKKTELIRRVEVMEEECHHFLRTYLSNLSDDVARRRGSSIISQFQKLLLVGHENGGHPLTVQLLVRPVEQFQGMQVPERVQGKLVVRIFMDASEGLLMMVTPAELIEGSLAVSTIPPRKTNFDEILMNGIKTQELVEGVLHVLHATQVQSMATMPTASA